MRMTAPLGRPGRQPSPRRSCSAVSADPRPDVLQLNAPRSTTTLDRFNERECDLSSRDPRRAAPAGAHPGAAWWPPPARSPAKPIPHPAAPHKIVSKNSLKFPPPSRLEVYVERAPVPAESRGRAPFPPPAADETPGPGLPFLARACRTSSPTLVPVRRTHILGGKKFSSELRLGCPRLISRDSTSGDTARQRAIGALNLLPPTHRASRRRCLVVVLKLQLIRGGLLMDAVGSEGQW